MKPDVEAALNFLHEVIINTEDSDLVSWLEREKEILSDLKMNQRSEKGLISFQANAVKTIEGEMKRRGL